MSDGGWGLNKRKGGRGKGTKTGWVDEDEMWVGFGQLNWAGGCGEAILKEHSAKQRSEQAELTRISTHSYVAGVVQLTRPREKPRRRCTCAHVRPILASSRNSLDGPIRDGWPGSSARLGAAGGRIGAGT